MPVAGGFRGFSAVKKYSFFTSKTYSIANLIGQVIYFSCGISEMGDHSSTLVVTGDINSQELPNITKYYGPGLKSCQSIKMRSSNIYIMLVGMGLWGDFHVHWLHPWYAAVKCSLLTKSQLDIAASKGYELWHCPLYGPRPLKSTGWHGHFLNSTCDMEPIDMWQGFHTYIDMRQGYFLNLTCDMAINKRQRHATLAFLKIDRRHQDPPSRAPFVTARWFETKTYCLWVKKQQDLNLFQWLSLKISNIYSSQRNVLKPQLAPGLLAKTQPFVLCKCRMAEGVGCYPSNVVLNILSQL